MSKELKLIKNNKKSCVYENEYYKVKISYIDGGFLKRNDSKYVEYDDNLEPDDYKYTKAVILEITNKITGKASQKRCYQGYDVINDVKEDLYNGKKRFKSMFDRID